MQPAQIFGRLQKLRIGAGSLVVVDNLEGKFRIARSDAKVWAFLGDGEMDEPESITALSLAARKNVRGLVRMIPIAAAVFVAMDGAPHRIINIEPSRSRSAWVA